MKIYSADLTKQFTLTRSVANINVIDRFEGYLFLDDIDLSNTELFIDDGDKVAIRNKQFRIEDWGVTIYRNDDDDSMVIGMRVFAFRYPDRNETGFYGLV